MTSFEERMKNIRRDKELERERERERKGGTQPFFRGERGVFALWRVMAGQGTGSRFPVGACRTRNCQAATQIGPAPNNRAYYRPFVSGSRVTFFPFSLFLPARGDIPGATRVQGVVFPFKKAAIHCSGFEKEPGGSLLVPPARGIRL